MKIIFLLKASTARTAPDFFIKNLAGSSGRMDVVCRCIIAALAKPGGIRRGVDFYAVLEGPPSPPKLLKVLGSEVEHVPLSEVEVAEIIFWLLQGEKFKGYQIVERVSFRKIIDELLEEGFQLIYLHEEGSSLREALKKDRIAFVLGDHLGLDKDSELFLDQRGAVRVSLGPYSYMASHCIAAVLYDLGRTIVEVSPEMVKALEDC